MELPFAYCLLLIAFWFLVFLPFAYCLLPIGFFAFANCQLPTEAKPYQAHTLAPWA